MPLVQAIITISVEYDTTDTHDDVDTIQRKLRLSANRATVRGLLRSDDNDVPIKAHITRSDIDVQTSLVR